MDDFPIGKAFTLIEPGPVVLVTTNDGHNDNVMAISWTMVLDFAAKFAITTGAWNYSYGALTKTKECVIAIPTAQLLDIVVGVGTCSGADTDKFEKFGLTRMKATQVRAPLIAECFANIECRVVEIIQRHDMVVLQGVAVHVDNARQEKKRIHAIGDGTFVEDGRLFDRREAMRSKLPDGL